MRRFLLFKHAIIKRPVWKSPSSTPAQQRYFRTSQSTPLEGVDSESGLPRTCLGRATTVGFRESSNTAGALEDTQLPLSPLLDPDLLAARHRYKLPKPESSSEPSAFQKKLQKNPYAQALATPVRQCALTGSRLPDYFLVDFGLTPHPRTGKPWQMPQLAVDTNVVTSDVVSTVKSTEQDVTPSHPAVEPTASPKRSAQTAAGSHIIANQAAIKLISTLKQRSYVQMLPQRWKLDARFKVDQIVWREDMDTLVLGLLRKKVTKLLKYLSSQPAAYIVPCQDYESIQKSHQPGAVLWLGQPQGEDTVTSMDPPPYAMVEYRSSGHIPLYNLPALLGPAHMSELRDIGEYFEGPLAVIKRKRNTTGCQMQLWKLMGYLATETNAASLGNAVTG
ncbi:MAG: hypothetical protein Q9221_003520 [Calogaya cf. arnoldii]